MFQTFELTDIKEVRVIIVGQDPYFNEGLADGLAFSCNKYGFLPASLEVILKVAYACHNLLFNKKEVSDYSLTKWAEQNVLLLNRVLTVKEGSPRSHYKQGWEIFTDEVIKLLSKDSKPKVFALWGSDAQKVEKHINKTRHLVLTCAHPAAELYKPGAKGSFSNYNHFKDINEFLKQNGQKPINWIL